MKSIVIYKITSPSGGVYIGQTRHYRHRVSAYKRLVCKDQPRLYNSLKKHGVTNHTYEIIHELPFDAHQQIVNTYETLYIDVYKNCGSKMLNIKEGGSFGGHSMETRLKMKGRVLSEEVKQKMTMSKKGKKRAPFSEEWRANIGKKSKGHKHNLGKKLSQETKNKMSLMRKGRKMSSAFIEKNRARMMGNTFWLGKKHKPETLLKMGLFGEDNPMFNKRGGLSPSSKKVINTQTNEIYSCVQDAADAIGMKMKSLQKRLSGYWANTTTLKYL